MTEAIYTVQQMCALCVFFNLLYVIYILFILCPALVIVSYVK